MKKMICEICGSQSIRKENGVFICQECGTEYSLEEAKKLLKEIEGEAPRAKLRNGNGINGQRRSRKIKEKEWSPKTSRTRRIFSLWKASATSLRSFIVPKEGWTFL